MLNRLQTPPIKDAVDFNLKLPPYERFTLDNGVPVYSVNAGAQEVAMVELVFFAGNTYEDQNIVAATTNYLIKNGTSKKNALQINEHFEYFGTYLNRSCYNETAKISLHCLNKHLSEVLPVIGDLITDASFPEEELNIYRQNQKQRLEVNLKKCDFIANRLIDEYLYGINHPYGKYTTIKDYDELNREQLVNFYDKYYRNGKCIIFTAGKLSDDIIHQLIWF